MPLSSRLLIGDSAVFEPPNKACWHILGARLRSARAHIHRFTQEQPIQNDRKVIASHSQLDFQGISASIADGKRVELNKQIAPKAEVARQNQQERRHGLKSRMQAVASRHEAEIIDEVRPHPEILTMVLTCNSSLYLSISPFIRKLLLSKGRNQNIIALTPRGAPGGRRKMPRPVTQSGLTKGVFFLVLPG